MNRNFVFIISLPRSGSTLLQKLIMSNEKFESIEEPWFFINFLKNFSNDIKSIDNIGGLLSKKAFLNFIKHKNKNQFFKKFNEFSKDVFFEDSNKEFFIVKTPRNYYIINELHQIFPNSKFIVLTREIDEILLSISNTWNSGYFKNLHKYKNDITVGTKNIGEFLNKKYLNVFHLRYNDLINNENEIRSKLEIFLEIEKNSISKNISDKLNNSVYGDPYKPRTNIERKFSAKISWVNILISKILFSKNINKNFLLFEKKHNVSFTRSNINIKMWIPHLLIFIFEFLILKLQLRTIRLLYKKRNLF